MGGAMAKRSVVITGAATGIGEACARRFAAENDHLVLADSDEARLRIVADDLREKGATVSTTIADASNRLQVHNIIAEALESHGRIDVLVHASMAFENTSFLETTTEDFDRLLDANLKGAFNVNQAAARQMVRQAEDAGVTEEAGVIVNILSAEAVTASPDRVVFAATQGGAHQLTRAVAMALSSHAIRVNAVGIGAVKGETISNVDTKTARESVPLGRLGDPDDVADCVFFLTSPSAAYITGQTIYVDGGRLVRSIDSGESTPPPSKKGRKQTI